jgi:hypothetical protein
MENRDEYTIDFGLLGSLTEDVGEYTPDERHTRGDKLLRLATIITKSFYTFMRPEPRDLHGRP